MTDCEGELDDARRFRSTTESRVGDLEAELRSAHAEIERLTSQLDGERESYKIRLEELVEETRVTLIEEQESWEERHRAQLETVEREMKLALDGEIISLKNRIESSMEASSRLRLVWCDVCWLV